MTGWRFLASLFLCLALAFSPGRSFARAGAHFGGFGGHSYSSHYGSYGSRGSRTYHYNGAGPIERSTTPFATRNAAPRGPATAGAFGHHPFLSGIAGGLFGAWLGHMLFGGYGYGYGSPLGSLFHLLILGALIWFAFRLFRGFAAGAAGGGSAFGMGGPQGGGVGAGLGRAGPPAEAPRLSQADEAEFAALLTGVEEAWSRGDLEALRRLVTPEMLGYFAEALANNRSRGVENRVEQVHPLDLDIRESWSESGFDYVTAALTWSARDYTLRIAPRPGEGDVVVEGDPQAAHEATEIWTMLRAQGGGRWLLSAVQQLR